MPISMQLSTKGWLTNSSLQAPTLIRRCLLLGTHGIHEAICIALFAILPAVTLYQFDRSTHNAVKLAQNLPSNPLWIDARPQAEYAREHVPGALNLNDENWDHALAQVFDIWHPPRPIVVYCSEGCSAAAQVARKLTEIGIEPVEVYEGGFEKWKRSRS